jgi:hypothetical protein
MVGIIIVVEYNPAPIQPQGFLPTVINWRTSLPPEPKLLTIEVPIDVPSMRSMPPVLAPQEK